MDQTKLLPRIAISRQPSLQIVSIRLSISQSSPVKPPSLRSRSPGPGEGGGARFLPPCTKCKALSSHRMNVSACQARKRTIGTSSQGPAIWSSTAPVFPLSTADNLFIFRIQPLQREPVLHRLHKAIHFLACRCRKSKSLGIQPAENRGAGRKTDRRNRRVFSSGNGMAIPLAQWNMSMRIASRECNLERFS
jgi:hypothetical protein